MPTRIAHASWTGTLQGGAGTFNGDSGLSGSYSFASRFQDGKGSTPEELLAAAQAACFSMALEVALEKNGTPATDITTDAACSIVQDGGAFKISLMQLRVRGTVPNLDNAKFVELANATMHGCPVAKSLAGNVDFTLDAELVQVSSVVAMADSGTFPNIRV